MILKSYRINRIYNKILNLFEIRDTLKLVDNDEEFKLIDLENSFLALYDYGKLVEISPIIASNGKVSIIKVYYEPLGEDLKKGTQNNKTDIFKNTNIDELKNLFNKIVNYD